MANEVVELKKDTEIENNYINKKIYLVFHLPFYCILFLVFPALMGIKGLYIMTAVLLYTNYSEKYNISFNILLSYIFTFFQSRFTVKKNYS